MLIYYYIFPLVGQITLITIYGIFEAEIKQQINNDYEMKVN